MRRRSVGPSRETLLSAAALRAALYRRVEEYLRASIDQLDEQGLIGAVEAPTPGEMIARVVAAAPVAGIERDPWSEALLRGAAIKQEVAQLAGGLLSSGEVADLLGVSVAAVKQRQRRGKLLGVPTSNGEWGYPAKQFSTDGRVREGVLDVLSAFPPRTSPWVVLSFLANPSPDGRAAVAFDVADEPESAAALVELARTYGEQTAT